MPAIGRLFEQDAPAAQDEIVSLRAKFKRASRFFSRQYRWIRRPTRTLHGTMFTFWLRPTDERAQFHQGGIVFAGVFFREKPGGRGPKLFSSGAGIDRYLQVEEAGENPRDVCFDDRDRLVESKGRYRVGSVAANAGQIADQIRRFREATAVFSADGDSGGSQISGARIIAKTLPGVENVRFRGGGKSGDTREAAHPRVIVGQNRRDLGLLEHELGNQNRVWIRGAAPWEIAAFFAIPGKKQAAERGARDRLHS